MGASILFNLWTLRQEIDPPQAINDTAIHQALTSWVEGRVTSGGFPLDGWFPPISLGAPRLHHYQALPYVITGTLQAVVADAFPVLTYLLLAGWPGVVYVAARRFELDPWGSALAACATPLVRSLPGFGFESWSYTWFGPGLWPQLWAMWTFPLALAWSWTAIEGRTSTVTAVLLGGATICLHLPTGYLFVLLLPVLALASTRSIGRRLARATILLGGAIAVAAWQIVPALLDRRWTALDQIAAVRFRWDSFGAGSVLSWLWRGELFDVGRAPIVTLLAAVGIVSIAVARGRPRGHRVVLLIGVVSLVLFFGRPTLGPLAELLPFGSSLSFRRFIVGVHLAGVFLAGIGGVWLANRLLALARRSRPVLRLSIARASVATLALATAIVGYAGVAELRAVERDLMARQHVVDRTIGAGFVELVALAERDGGVRVYAGTNARPATVFRIGRAPSYIALLNAGGDVVGYRRPTWSLLSGVEARFNPRDLDQYRVLGISHVIAPGSEPPFADAERISTSGAHTLWRVNDVDRYLEVGRSRGRISASRITFTPKLGEYLASAEPDRVTFPGVAYDGLETAPPEQAGVGSPGSVRSSTVPAPGTYTGVVHMEERGVVLLRASYDPGWVVEIDGRPSDLSMVAPGFPATELGPGTHHVSFRYRPADRYPWLFAIGFLGVLTAWVFERKRRRPGTIETRGGGQRPPPGRVDRT